MTEPRYRLWDTAIKIIALIVTALGAYYGYKHALEEFALNNRKPYLEMKSKYNLELVEVVSRIAYPTSTSDRDQAIQRFWQLYAGASSMVEDSIVEEKVASLSQCIKTLNEKNGCQKFELEAGSLLLATTVRDSLVRAWHIEAADGSDAPKPAGIKP